MKLGKILSAIFITTLLFSCGEESKTEVISDEQNNETIIKSDSLLSTKGYVTAKATLTSEAENGLSGIVIITEYKDSITEITADLSNLSKGEHEIHFSALQSCGASDSEYSWYHDEDAVTNKGNIGNISTDDQGNGRFALKSEKWCLTCEDSTRNILGQTIIIESELTDKSEEKRSGCGLIELHD